MSRKVFIRYGYVLLVFFFQCISTRVVAQPGKVLFHEDFGNPIGRVPLPGLPSGFDAFTFADPDYVYPLPIPSWATDWASSDVWWQNAAKHIENNHYAVVAPSNIYTSVSSWVGGASWGGFWTALDTVKDVNPSSNSSGVYEPGTWTGGALVINGGLTRGILFQSPVNLQAGRYYKVSYWIFVQNGDIELRIDFVDAATNKGLGAARSNKFPNGSGPAHHKWTQQTRYFYVPSGACANTEYKALIRNNYLVNSGSDYALDEIMMTEVAADEVPKDGSASVIFTPCTDKVPVANNDVVSVPVWSSTAVVIPILSNDLTKDKDQATFTNSILNFIVPQGSVRTENSWEGIKVKVSGQGVWHYDNVNSWSSNYGKLAFTPEAGFKGDPTPIQYVIANEYTYNNPEAPGGSALARVTSPPATVTINYGSVPTAVGDLVTTPGGRVENIFILANDRLIDGSPATPATVTVCLKNPSTGIIEYKPSVNPVVVPGEGKWTYDTTAGILTFTPQDGFIDKPSPITYTIHEGEFAASAIVTVSLAALSTTISGEVWIDANGLKNTKVDGVAYNTAANPKPDLYVVLLDENKKVVATDLIENGAYQFTDVPYSVAGIQYSVMLRANNPAAGADYSAAVATYPTDVTYPWVSTGESLADNVDDAPANGVLELLVIDAIDKANFGVQQQSHAEPITSIAPNSLKIGEPYVLDNDDQMLEGSDPEDGMNLSAARNFVITHIIPGTRIFYDGHEIMATELASPGQLVGGSAYIITNYDPLKFSVAFATDKLSIGFNYSFVDASGFAGVAENFKVNKAFLLPAVGLALQATRLPQGAQMSWSTNAETETDYFVVQRSSNGTQYTNLGTVKAAGNSSLPNQYTFKDANIALNTVYYRVVLHDKDGHKSYSNVVTLQADQSASDIQVYPNPARTGVYIQVQKPGTYQLMLMDMKGSLIATKTVTINAVTEKQWMALPGTTANVYMLKVYEQQTHQSSVVKIWQNGE
ncbi:MAG TPA: T9SS type A sorting domain-containing protein [Phnomibacter sp.]|nr:T9SS type A sorting domain-containing protein [Phnomibacter sp.]